MPLKVPFLILFMHSQVLPATKTEFEGAFEIHDGDSQGPDETARGFFRLLYNLQIVEIYTTGRGINDTSDTPFKVMFKIVMGIQAHEIWRHDCFGVHARTLALPIVMRAIQICIKRCVQNHHNIRKLHPLDVHNTVEENTIDNLMGHLVQLLRNVGTSDASIDVQNLSPASESLPPVRYLLVDTLMTSIDCLAHLLTWNTGDITLDEV